MAPSIPVTPYTPRQLPSGTSPMGAAVASWHSWTNMAEHAQFQILIPSWDAARSRVVAAKIVPWIANFCEPRQRLVHPEELVVVGAAFESRLLLAIREKYLRFRYKITLAQRGKDYDSDWFFYALFGKVRMTKSFRESRRARTGAISQERVPASNSKSTSGGIGHGCCHVWR